MVFSSILFLFYFLPLVLGIYYLALVGSIWRPRHRVLAAMWFVPRLLVLEPFFGTRTKHVWLTLLSYLFYGWANPLFILLMFSSTMINYLSGLAMTGQFRRGSWKPPPRELDPGGARSTGQRLALIIGVCANLAMLGFFKYYNFGIDTWNAIFRSAGLDGAVFQNFLRITLPLGISFYTFQAMSYTIDVYRGEARAIRSWVDFACYVSMFPQLVAGPIIRFQEVADQIEQRTHSLTFFARGVTFFALGLAKKVLLADPCGKVADVCFGADGIGCADGWYGAIAYGFQIYFDFSAYSDMAIGLGLMFGFTFAKNFDSPYLSCSLTEFWRRWHLSLSTWLRDYLYVPLGGNRKGSGRTYVNLMLVMLLGGLWHGAAWNFVIWGGIHGVFLALERMAGKQSFYHRLPVSLRIVLTYVIVLVAWVFFRAPDLPTAMTYLDGMAGLGTPAPGAGLIAAQIYTPYHLLTVLAAAGVTWWGIQSWDFTRRLTWPRVALIFAGFILALLMLVATSFHPFIYFIF